MKSRLVFSFKWKLIIYSIAYLVYSFVTWTFLFPFKWVLQISTYSSMDRFFILIGVISIEIILFQIYTDVQSYKKTNK